jgi:hypothetical protein
MRPLLDPPLPSPPLPAPPRGQFGEAADAYTTALRYAREADDVATLLSNRSAAYARWAPRRLIHPES